MMMGLANKPFYPTQLGKATSGLTAGASARPGLNGPRYFPAMPPGSMAPKAPYLPGGPAMPRQPSPQPVFPGMPGGSPVPPPSSYPTNPFPFNPHDMKAGDRVSAGMIRKTDRGAQGALSDLANGRGDSNSINQLMRMLLMQQLGVGPQQLPY